ncbi:MAG: outer membrane protein assembly factor BamB family protein [Pirellulaceae bacterium]
MSFALTIVVWLSLAVPSQEVSSTLEATPSAPAPPALDWPFIRGPDFDGRSAETALVDRWPDAGPPVLWVSELGQGYSSFVAWNDRVATQAQTLAGQYVICLRADTGQVIWRYRYDWPYEPAGVYPGPRSTPTYANGKVYFASPNGVIGCLNAENGELLWSRNPVREFHGRGIEFGYSCSPTVIDNKVILPIGGHGASMIALNATDGTVVWHNGDDPASYTPAYPILFGGRSCVLGYLQNVLVCHDLQTGERLWRHGLSSGYDEHSAWPVYREPYLWISSPFQGGSELLELTGDPASPVRTVWKSRVLSNDIFSSVLVDDALFGFDLHEAQAKAHRPSRGAFVCIDFLSGRVHWTYGDPRRRRAAKSDPLFPPKDIGHATVIVADGKLILFNDTGELILARARSERYEELARVSVLAGEICWTQPVLRGGRLFVRNQSRAACIYLGEPEQLDPKMRARLLTTHAIPQQPYVDLAALILGVEPEYAFDIPSREWIRTWYALSNGILAGSLLAVLVACAMIRLWTKRWPNYVVARYVCWGLMFLLGAVGTTILSRWRNDFVFTWPVSIFAVFQAVVAESRWRRLPQESPTGACRSIIVAALFVLSCFAYYWLCRRLSLVTEWAFLCGFTAALPCSFAGAICFRRSRWRLPWEAVMTLFAFAGFYWSAVAVQVLKS